LDKDTKYLFLPTFKGSLLQLTQKNQKIMKVYGSKIKYFTFIRPTNETVATINNKNILQVWDVSTGEFVKIVFI